MVTAPNTRRGFFKAFGAVIGGLIVAPQILIPKASDAFRWKQLSSGVYVGDIDQVVFRTTSYSSIWLNLVMSEKFPCGMGEIKRGVINGWGN